MLVNTDFATFQQHFESRLGEMLSPDELGAFILVLANSMQDKQLHQGLMPRLKTLFTELQDRYKAGKLQGAEDDLQVFGALYESGIDHFSTWETRQLTPWQSAYNPLRALRPARAAKDSFVHINRPFNEQAFHFDKPFLQPEIMAEEDFNGRTLRVMFHKFPFAPYHLLLLLEASAHLPQYLDTTSHELFWTLTEKINSGLPGIAIAYNSLGAGASINHQHTHAFIQQTPLAIEQPDWRHNGGTEKYPINCHRIDSVRESGQLIEEFHASNQPFNLLYRPGCCYLIPRKPQGTQPVPDWMQGAAWYEVSGAFNLADQEQFLSLKADQITKGLELLSLRPTRFSFHA